MHDGCAAQPLQEAQGKGTTAVSCPALVPPPSAPPALPCPALPCPALPCPALPCPAPPCPALPCPALPRPAPPRPAPPRPAPPRPAPPRPAPPRPAPPPPPCPALPCPALPCPALPCPALPCPALPCPALPCTALRHPSPCLNAGEGEGQRQGGAWPGRYGTVGEVPQRFGGCIGAASLTYARPVLGRGHLRRLWGGGKVAVKAESVCRSVLDLVYALAWGFSGINCVHRLSKAPGEKCIQSASAGQSALR